MTQEGLQESQEEIAQGVPQPGHNDQVVGSYVDTPPGATEQSTKTYSQEDWDVREKALTDARASSDRQLAQARQDAAETALQRQIETSENYYRMQDQQAVEDGQITEGQAQQRVQQRQQSWQQHVRQTQQTANARAEYLQLVAENEGLAREQVADILSKEHGVELKALLSDKASTTAGSMVLRARELALDKRQANLEGTETYDGGQKGASGVSIAQMTPLEKIAFGVAHPPKRAR
jgi:hypothetical protein